ncbi:thiamine phosphate synthase [Paenibacillus terrigena]|uniref:thiamine phosphate synthase n=1 Tax=Paenibacillus terrigena TaxID=369333 RepID=UPI000380CB6D|nr:thiamine phosphate synthase [Paenibacillus terrigena]
MELHLVSPGFMPLQRFAEIAAEVHPHVQFIHLREKQSTAKEMLETLQRMMQLGVPAQKLLINDRVDVACVAQIGGVHLAHHSLPIRQVKLMSQGLRIGRSVHSVEEAIHCEAEGADYLFYGHIYASSSKPGLSPRGLKALREVAASVSIPVIGIGGIGPDQVQEVMQQGAQGIAVISGIVSAVDPLTAAMQYVSKLNERRSFHAANS